MTDQPGDRRNAVTAAPTTRKELLVLHAQARARRDAAGLGSEAYRAAALEVGDIEIAIAALETGVPASKR
jgi:hypothetical protein